MPLIESLPGARQDFDESFDWYAERSVPTAIHFTAAVEAALAKIIADSSQFWSSDGIHHECPLKKFPFRAIDRITDEGVLIVAISHAKRRPGYWRNRN